MKTNSLQSFAYDQYYMISNEPKNRQDSLFFLSEAFTSELLENIEEMFIRY